MSIVDFGDIDRVHPGAVLPVNVGDKSRFTAHGATFVVGYHSRNTYWLTTDPPGERRRWGSRDQIVCDIEYARKFGVLIPSGEGARSRNRTAGSSTAADLNRRLHAVALAHPHSPVAVIERGECRGEAGPIVAETTRGYPRRLTVAVSIARDGGPGDGHPCEVTENDVISRRPAPEREVDRLRRVRAERSHELTPGMNYANATAGAARGRPVGYRCRGCGTVTRRLPKSCARCKR